MNPGSLAPDGGMIERNGFFLPGRMSALKLVSKSAQANKSGFKSPFILHGLLLIFKRPEEGLHRTCIPVGFAILITGCHTYPDPLRIQAIPKVICPVGMKRFRFKQRSIVENGLPGRLPCGDRNGRHPCREEYPQADEARKRPKSSE